MSNKLVKNSNKEEVTSDSFFKSTANTFIFIGILWLVLTAFIFSFPQDYEKYDIIFLFKFLIFTSLGHILLGIVLHILLHNKTFKKWCDKDFKEFKNKYPDYFNNTKAR